MTEEDNVSELHPTDGRPPVEFLNNGTIRIHADRGLVRLRRPKLKELRKIQERLEEVREDIADLSTEGQVATREINERHEEIVGDDPERALSADELRRVGELRRESRERAKVINRGIERLTLQWFAHVVEMLADERLDIVDEDGEPGDDAEAWMVEAGLSRRLVRHWQTVPLASGAR